MKPHEIRFARSAWKELESLEKAASNRVLQAIEKLAENPRPVGCKKLQGEKDAFRIRVGVYRVVYEIEDKKLVVLIVRVRHRKDAY